MSQQSIYLTGGYIYQNCNRKANHSVLRINTQSLEVERLSGMSMMRQQHVSAVIGGRLIVHGGVNLIGEFVEDVEFMDIRGCSWTTSSGKARRAGHTAVTVGQEDQYALVFGGYLNRNFDCTDELTYLRPLKIAVISMHVKTKGARPAPRYRHVMALHERGKKVFVCGGRDGHGQVFRDCFVLALEGWEWTALKVSALGEWPCVGHAGDLHQGSLVLFGGFNRECRTDSRLYKLRVTL